MITSRPVGLAVWCLLAAAAPVSGQSVSDVLTFLLTNQSVATGSVERDRSAAQATSDTIARALRENLATLPVPASPGAFALRLNPQLGTVERVTQTFGPSFVDRAQTTGSGQAAFSLTFQHLRFNSLDGTNLRDGSFMTTANKFVDESSPFDVDRLMLNMDASIVTLAATVGITDELEIAVAAPIVSLHVDGSRVNTYRGRTFTQADARAESVGLADLTVRSKYRLSGDGGSGIAAAVDLRLPTGREQNLLGAGSPALKVSGIGSIERGALSAHGNAGFTVGGLAPELSYNGAVAVAASPRVTLVGELLGRWVDSPGDIVPLAGPHPSIPGVQTIRLVPGTASLRTVILVPGFRWNLTDTWVMAGSVSVPLTHAGLTAAYAPFIGFDYVLEH
jgi:hypothetical protein